MSEQPKSNILKALDGEAVTTNQPKSRILQAIENGGGSGGGSSYDDLVRRIEALENKQETFIAVYHDSTAQEIIAFLENNPHAPVLVQNGDDVYSTIFSKVLAGNKVMLRTIASLQGKFNLFEYTVTDTSWNGTTTPLYYDDAALWEWIDALKLFTYKVIIDNIEVPAAVNGVGGRVNVQGDIIDLPEGYEVKALRSYSVQRVTGAASGDQSWKQGNFNMIGTAGGGRKGNLGILNNSNEPVFVKVQLEYNCGKVYPQQGA